MDNAVGAICIACGCTNWWQIGVRCSISFDLLPVEDQGLEPSLPHLIFKTFLAPSNDELPVLQLSLIVRTPLPYFFVLVHHSYKHYYWL